MQTQRLEKPGFLNFSGIWRKGRIPSIHPQDRNQAIINLETTYTEIHHTLSHLQFIISCWLIHTRTVKNDCIIQSILCLIHYVEKKILSGENFPSTSIYIKHSKKGWNWKTMTWNRQRLWKHGHDQQSPPPNLCSPNSCPTFPIRYPLARENFAHPVQECYQHNHVRKPNDCRKSICDTFE